MEPPPPSKDDLRRYDLPPVTPPSNGSARSPDLRRGAVTLKVAPELARLLHRLQQLRNKGALLAMIDLRTLELYPALSVERLAPQPKSVLHSG